MIEVTENPVEFDVDDEYLEIYAEQLSAEAFKNRGQAEIGVQVLARAFSGR